jgi:hypothetical protein
MRRIFNDQHNFVAVDDFEPVEFALGDGSNFDAWIWEPSGIYNLDAGQHTLELTRTYGEDPQYSVFIDALLLSADPGYDPNTDGVWELAFDSDKQPYAAQHELPDGLPPGEYRWFVRLFADDRLVNWLGESGLEMPPVSFTVAP